MKWYATYQGVDTGMMLEEVELWEDQYALLLQAGYTNPVQTVADSESIYVHLNELNRIDQVWKEQGGVLDKAAARKRAKEALYGVQFHTANPG